jgi:hypothetical protein
MRISIKQATNEFANKRVEEISGSHGDEYEDGCLPGWSAVYQALMMEAVRTSETSVNFYKTAWRNIP